MHIPQQGSQSAPHARPAHGFGGQVNVPCVTHWSCASHAVGANVGTGQVDGSAPGGQ